MKTILTIILFFISSPIWATTYYVRDGGGTATQCTGTTNATYPGSGTSQPCAFIHPRYLLGWDADNPQSAAMVGGDTGIISGDSDINPGQQAQYLIGYDNTGAGTTPTCSSSVPADCILLEIPAGSDATHRTTIVGAGNHKPQLWGNEKVFKVLQADNNYIALINLEVTSHSNCGLGFGVNACASSYPFGQWARDGIEITGTGSLYQDLYIHNIKRYGIFTESLADNTFTRVYSIGNGQGGFNSDPSVSFTGTLTWNQPIVEWNGCEEAYPLMNAGIDNPLNYSNCTAQDGTDGGGTNGIIADGIAFGNAGSGTTGNWNIFGPGSISFNTQDGLDLLHGSGSTGTVQIDKMRFEGNAGQQIKLVGPINTLTNSIVIGDCGWWYGSAQAIAGGMGTGGTGSCRANGDTILFGISVNNTVETFYNNTILSNGSVIFLENNACNSTNVLNIKNNIVLGGYDWIDDTTWNGGGSNKQPAYIFLNGPGCSSPTINEDYNIIKDTSNSNSGCNGAHDKCGTDPGFLSGTFPMGTSGGGANTYYQGNSGITFMPISGSSAALNAGLNGLTYWNTENDNNNVVRSNPPSIGGLELSSCAANGYGCQFNSICCSLSCNANACGAITPVFTSGETLRGSFLIKGITFQ